MRTLVLFLALFSLAPLPAAAAPDATEEAARAPLSAPATVLEHRETVTVDGGRRLVRTVTWTVRVDDPAGCAAGLLTPPGLDGATDGGAMVLEDLLIVPPDAQEGDTFTLSATVRGDRGGHSGVFVTAPDLPVEEAVFEVRTPGWLPLHVWFDPGAHPEHGGRGGRSITMTWSDIPAGGAGQAVWSTWADWMEPGTELTKQVDGLMATKDELGRVLAADIAHLDVASVTERVFRAVKVEPGQIGTWKQARPAKVVARAGSGSAADRGALLLSLLRLAGHDAVPGLFRPAAVGGAFPVSVPAPAMLSRPVVVVRHADRTVYVDPAADLAEVPDLPASMAGGSVWLPGDLPVRLNSPDLVDGTVIVNSNVNIGADGSASWTATITASGTASEWLRELLSPLDDDGRTEALKRLATIARPELKRFTASTTGIGRPDRKLKITVSGHDTKVMAPLGAGLTGELPMLLAPAVAAWLPPNVRVRELMSITPPGTVQVLSVRPSPSTFAEEALVSRTYGRQGQRQVLSVEVERPYRATTAAQDAAAKRFLDEQARAGFELLLVGAADGKTAKSLKAAVPDPADQAVLEAMLWWSVQSDKRALKVLRKSGVPIAALLRSLERYVEPGRAAPWQALAQVAREQEDEAGLLAVAEGMERNNLRADALARAWQLEQAGDAAIRAQALLMIERLQGEKPKEGDAPWREPAQLVEAAAAAAPEHPRVVIRRARQALEAGQVAEAETMLEQIAASSDDPSVHVLLAQAAAGSGVAADDVAARIRSAVARAPHDPRVVRLAAEASGAVGMREDASRYALTAARMAATDADAWSFATTAALEAGELPTAAYAARKASDVDAADRERGRILGVVAALVGDREGAELGRQRAADEQAALDWPPTLDQLMWLAPESALYAVLVHHDDAVTADPRLLAMRAQMRIERGHLDEAARDGVLLATRHGVAEGQALAFASTVGRLYSSTADRALDSAANADSVARLTRMEYRLLTGAGDASVDARALDNARASVLTRLRSAPAEVIAEVEGWPQDLPTPKGAGPAGFRKNWLLGAAPGLSAWSDPDAAVAVIRVGGVTGLLPPPLANLYTPVEPPLKTRPDGVQVLRLDGGVMPLFVAMAVVGEEEVLGVGFTREAAERAIDRALQ